MRIPGCSEELLQAAVWLSVGCGVWTRAARPSNPRAHRHLPQPAPAPSSQRSSVLVQPSSHAASRVAVQAFASVPSWPGHRHLLATSLTALDSTGEEAKRALGTRIGASGEARRSAELLQHAWRIVLRPRKAAAAGRAAGKRRGRSQRCESQFLVSLQPPLRPFSSTFICKASVQRHMQLAACHAHQD